ncbi:MAG: hypothetical protein ACJ74Z_06405 [Bryobacteraceae bacterium]
MWRVRVISIQAHPTQAVRLNLLGMEEGARKRGTRHGSTRWLCEREAVSAAIRYVIQEQGDPIPAFGTARADRVVLHNN